MGRAPIVSITGTLTLVCAYIDSARYARIVIQTRRVHALITSMSLSTRSASPLGRAGAGLLRVDGFATTSFLVQRDEAHQPDRSPSRQRLRHQGARLRNTRFDTATTLASSSAGSLSSSSIGCANGSSVSKIARQISSRG